MTDYVNPLAHTGQQSPSFGVPSNPLVPPEYEQSIDYDSAQYMNGFLRTQIGRAMRIEQLIGSNGIQDRYGFLVGVGNNYLLLQRISNETLFINIGRTEGILSANEQVPGERYQVNDRLKVYIMDVKKTNKGPQVFLSRSHPGLVKRLFELEVPEIEDGTVEIKGIAREAGSRTKMAVYTEFENVDPVGACVGTRGARVQAIVDELHGEKIDIIAWSEDPEELIASVLSPAKVEKVLPAEDGEKAATVVVPDYQLSLAIGKEGQNVRLAAKVSGWKIDIKSHSQFLAAQEAASDIVELDDTADEAEAYDETPAADFAAADAADAADAAAETADPADEAGLTETDETAPQAEAAEPQATEITFVED